MWGGGEREEDAAPLLKRNGGARDQTRPVHAASNSSGMPRYEHQMANESSNDPMLQLKAVIALAAQERSKKNQKSRDDQAAIEKRRDQARDV